MKIFGLQFGKDNTIADEVDPVVDIVDVTPPEVDDEELETKAIQTIRRVANPSLGYQNAGGSVARPSQRRNIFEPSEYDLYEIGRIEDVESYARQAFKKQVGLFLKEGFDYVGPNKKTIKYLKTRFAQIERATGIPHEELIRRLVSSLVRKSNAFLVKVRNPAASGGRVRVDANGKSLKPIAGYYPLPAETMQVDTDGSGRPLKWRQMLPSGAHLEFAPEDIVHIHFDRKEGFLFGTPLIQPVIDDIRALRKIEENIELLIYKHLFPLFQYVVGTETHPADVTEDGQREVDVARMEIMGMPSEGGIVTPERHEIRMIGAESKALRAESYLTHFKNRVFSGLGMSAVDFGEPDTSNKSTADNMSRALIDNIKDMQDSFEAQFNLFIINELLEESTFGEDVLLPENGVHMEFREVDIDKQIKMENHAVDVFTKHGITWDELRVDLGRDPITVPDDPETQNREEHPEWFRTYWKLFAEPEKLINAGDEPYSTAAIAAAQSVSTEVKPTDLEAQKKSKQEADVNLAKEKEKAKPKPVIRKKDNFLKNHYNEMEALAVSEFERGTVNYDYAKRKIELAQSKMTALLQTHMNTAFISAMGPAAQQNPYKVQVIRNSIHDRSHLIMKRLVTDIVNALKRKVDSDDVNVKISTVRLVFDAFQYRIDFIVQAEIARATNLGRILNATEGGGVKARYIVAEQTCETCSAYAQHEVTLTNYTLDNVPPHHPNCTCGLQITEVKGN